MLSIIQGSALEKLRELPTESVQCCVTSPPYWGLRDYGTAEWDTTSLRDAELRSIAERCDHIPDRSGGIASSTLDGGKATTNHQQEGWKGRDCGKCGARRIDSQLGLEATPEEYVEKMVAVFREVKRVLRKDGTLWLNLGDSYAVGGNNSGNTKEISEKQGSNRGNRYEPKPVPDGLKPKDLCGIPWRVAFALQADGWWLRSDIIWAKPNPMPESVTDRPTKAHEYLFLLTKSANYFYDAEAIKEKGGDNSHPKRTDQQCAPVHSEYLNQPNNNGQTGLGANYLDNRNKRSVWTIATAPFSDWTETVRWKRVEAGARGDGTRRIVSPNSLTDGGLFDLLATVLYDEHGEKSLNDICGICDRLSLEPRDGYVPSEKLRAYYFGGERLDFFLRQRLLSAIDRNNGKNKTDLFVATNLACKPSVERSCRIARILELHGWSDSDRDTLLSNTWPDDWPVHLWEQTLYHIGDNASCEGMYRKASKMQSHFATYPPDLIKPCIMAGTSAKGCCAKCGAPWERVVERVSEGKSYAVGKSDNKRGQGLATAFSGYDDGSSAPSFKTLGWRATCKCEAGVEPCTVLDPFAGSGTTGMVALEMGRKAILIELNPNYIQLIRDRCNVTHGLALC